MKECNNKEYADEFCNMINKLIASENHKVWCSLIEYVNAGTGEANRKGIIASFPVNGNRALGSER